MINRKWMGYALAIGLALMATSSRADLRYTTQMAFGEPGSERTVGQGSRTTTFVKNNDERVESVIAIGPIAMKSVTLILCQKKQVLQLDPELKIYTVSPLNAAPASLIGASNMAPGRSGPATPKAKTGTGKIVMTYAVEDKGTEKVLNLDARHSIITIQTQSSGCAGNATTTMKMEVWTAPIQTVNCPARFVGTDSSGASDAGDTDGCKVSYEFRGDVEKMKEIFSGMIVQQKLYQDDRVVMTQTLREHSLAELDPALFTVPADFRKVSEDEFNSARQSAIQKRMISNIGKAREDDTPEDEETPPDDDTGSKPKRRIRIPGLPF